MSTLKKHLTICHPMRSGHVKIRPSILSTFSLAVLMMFISFFYALPAVHAASFHRGDSTTRANLAVPNIETDPCLYVSIVFDNVSVVSLPLGVGQKYRVRLFIGNGCGHSIPAGGGSWSIAGKGTCDFGVTFLISAHYGTLPSLPAHSAPQQVDSATHISFCNVIENGVIVAQVLPIHLEYFANASYTYRVGTTEIELTGSDDKLLY
jgi:hypothetical protein